MHVIIIVVIVVLVVFYLVRLCAQLPNYEIY